MIKGSQKQLIVVRTGNSRYFDEAYFVLRRELQNERCDRSDILLEADRILRESAPQDGRGKHKKRRRRPQRSSPREKSSLVFS